MKITHDRPSPIERSITAGPFAIFFTNVNTAMGIPGHSHFAEVTLEFRSLGAIGFPAFEHTYEVIQAYLVAATVNPFRGATNEDVADQLWNVIQKVDWSALDHFGGKFELCRLELAVRGVPDKIGHADGFTRYTVKQAAQEQVSP